MRAPARLLIPLICLTLMVIIGILASCQSQDPVGTQIAGALNDGLTAIRQDAELGIRVRADPNLSQAAGVAQITPDAAAFARETLDYHKALIDLLRDRSTNTVDPNAPLPLGPTSGP